MRICCSRIWKLSGEHGNMFLLNGGKSTVESYGVSAENSSRDHLRAAIPPDHLAFYQSLVSYYVTEPYFCVHAGVNPLKTLPEQTDEELLWIRHPFLYSSHVLPYTVLFRSYASDTRCSTICRTKSVSIPGWSMAIC